ncbi:MAG: GC-type dockerin domain-anchored protein [Phycisphaerales bacterium]
MPTRPTPTLSALATPIAMALLAPAALAGLDPILRYTFDDMANPTANTGTLGAAYDASVGPGIVFVPFAGGFAIEKSAPLDSQVVPLGAEGVFDLADANFTVRATISTTYLDPDVTGGMFVVTKQLIGNDPGWYLMVQRNSGLARFGLADGTQSLALFSCTSVNDGLPHILTGVRDGDRVALLVDGVVESAGRVPSNFGSTSDNPDALAISGRALGNGTPTTGLNDEFVGLIDDVEIYDAAVAPTTPSNPADLAPPYGVYDFSDVLAFLNAFGAMQPDADIATPIGVYDFSDVLAFLTAFGAGCP